QGPRYGGSGVGAPATRPILPPGGVPMTRTSTVNARRLDGLRSAGHVVSPVASGLGLTACVTGTEEPVGSPTPETTVPSPADSPTTEPADDPAETTTAGDGQALVDGTREVDVQTYGALWVTTSVEGGLTTVSDPAESEVPTTWVIEPFDPAA